MDRIFGSRHVWEKKISIPLKKLGKGLLYTVGVTGISFMYNLLTMGEVPYKWVIYTGVIIAFIQAILKGLEIYDPMKDR